MPQPMPREQGLGAEGSLSAPRTSWYRDCKVLVARGVRFEQITGGGFERQVFTVLLALCVVILAASFCCSLSEAALYAVPLPHARHLAASGSRAGRTLLQLKEQSSRPIAAILIVNTLANVAGSALVGALASDVLTEQGLVGFSLGFTILVLFVGEIVPKVLGVRYAREVAPFVALPISVTITLCAPLMMISEVISRRLGANDRRPSVSLEEVMSIAEIGQEEGTLDELEGSVIANVVGLDRVLVRDILTPRVVVFRVAEEQPLSAFQADLVEWKFSRVPVFAKGDPEHLTGYVTQRDIYREIVRGNSQRILSELKRPLDTLPELLSVDRAMLRMFEKKEQICAVIDEHGGLAGIVTLEDIIEEVVGHEIMDEYDTVSDLRSFAKILQLAKSKRRGGG